MITTHTRVYVTGCCSGQASLGATRAVLPNSSRAAWVIDETGFHSANVSNGPGSDSSGTNVLARNVIGKITMNAAWLSTSTLGMSRPTQAITHDTAYAKSSSST